LSGNNLKLRFVSNTKAVITFDLGFAANFLLVNQMCVNTYTGTLLSSFAFIECQILIRKAELLMLSWDMVEIVSGNISTQNAIPMLAFTTNKHTCDVEIFGYRSMLFYATVEPYNNL